MTLADLIPRARVFGTGGSSQPSRPTARVSPEEMRKLVQTLVPGPVPGHPHLFRDALIARAGDPRWGLHLRPNGATPEDIIAFVVPAQGKPYQIFDIIGGSKSDTPQRGWIDQTHTMEDGSRFAPVLLSTGALTRLRVDGLRFLRDGLPWQWRGASAFDLPLRVSEGNLAFADWLATEDFTLARIVPASMFRTPRTLAQGIAHLPACLEALMVRGLYAEVATLVDTGLDHYGMGRADMRSYTKDVGEICAAYRNVVVELSNEPFHGTQSPSLLDPGFIQELRSLISTDIPVSWGSTGLEDANLLGGDYVTIHSDRGKTPDENGADLADLQRSCGRPVTDDEPLGVADIAKGQRTLDPAYGEQLGTACRVHGLGGSTYHCEAGLTADVAVLGSIQREAARRFITAMRGQ